MLEYLRNYISNQDFDKLTVIVSHKTRKILIDFFDFLKESEIYFSVWQGEDNDTIGYIEKISDKILLLIDDTDSISLEGSYVAGFLTVIWVTKSIKQTEETNLLLDRGRFSMKCGKYKQALELFDKASILEPDNEELMLYKGLALFKLKMYKDAVLYCDNVLERFPDSKFMLLLKGMLLEKIGSTEEALSVFDRVIEKHPEYAFAWFIKGVFLHNIKQNSESLECFDKALELKPDDFMAWYQRGIVLSESARFGEAIESFDRALELVSVKGEKGKRTRNVVVDFIVGLNEIDFLDTIGYAKSTVEYIYLEKALALAQIGRHKEAVRTYNKAIRINPRNLQAWLGKGAELQVLEKYHESLKCFEKVLKEDPKNVMALKLKANSAGGFGIIAHPYNPAFLWGDWNASGFRGLEIISNQSNYSSSAVSKWDTLLTNNLQGIISGSYPKIIGMANSDVHNSTYMWGLNMNYIYTGSSSPPGTNRSTVYNNLKAGRVSASSDGSLAVFSLNSYAPGSVVNVNPGTNNISITVDAECARGDYYSPGGTIRIIKNSTAVLTDSFSGLSITRNYTLTATTDCYYRVEVTFNGIVGDHVEYSYCFVNPVYVNLP